MITVVAALIESGGKILACQRHRGGEFGLRWEFPGGKIEAGETPHDALARELLEELGVRATIGRKVYRTLHRYAEMKEPLELIFFAAEADAMHIENRVFEQIQWQSPESLAELDFLPADRELIEKLRSGTLRIGRV